MSFLRAHLVLLSAALVFLAVPISPARAAGFADCRQFFPGVQPQLPADARDRIPQRQRELCFDAFAVLHSGQSKTPVYAVERLTAAQIRDARDEERSDRFYPEARLPEADRAQLDDYEHSGFDRGHMAPAADMPTPDAMEQSFSLANMVPQAPQLNRRSWAGIEKATRKYVLRARGPVYVYTGPVFSKRARKIGDGKVWVPSYVYKLVYDPASGRAWAHWLRNSDSAKAAPPISYGELVQRTGIEFLPGRSVHD